MGDHIDRGLDEIASDQHAGPVTVRKRPVELRAIRYDDALLSDGMLTMIANFGAQVEPDEHWEGGCGHEGHADVRDLRVYNSSHEDWNLMHPGDWIMQGSLGEFYPVAPDVFEAGFDLVGPGMPSLSTAVEAALEGDGASAISPRFVTTDDDIVTITPHMWRLLGSPERVRVWGV